MHVLQLLPALHGGGVERGTLEMVAALRADGHRAGVVSAGGQLAAEVVRLGGEHHQLPIGAKSLRWPGSVRRLRKLVTTLEPDVIHLRSRLPAWAWRLARIGLAPIPRVATLHGLNSRGPYSAIMLDADRIIAVSETARDYWTANWMVAPDDITVIHRGIDNRLFAFGYQPQSGYRDSLLKEFDWKDPVSLLCFPGRIARGKGQSDAISLMQSLGDRYRGLIVGDGPDHRVRELRAAIEAAGVADRLRITGNRRDLRDIMATSLATIVLSTKPESFGRVAVESLALGVPVVGYAHGGIGEILGNVYPSGAAPLGDVAQVASRVESIAAGEAPTVPDRQPYRLSTMCEQTITLYRELLDHNT